MKHRKIIFLLALIGIAVISGSLLLHKKQTPWPNIPVNLGSPVWSPTGSCILVSQAGAQSPHKLISVNVLSGQSTVLAELGHLTFLGSFTWAGQDDRIGYISSKMDASLKTATSRTLHMANAKGERLLEVGLPRDFGSSGMVWTREGRIVIVDTPWDDTNKDGSPVRLSVVRVFTDKLKKEREFELPYNLYDIRLHPKMPNSIVGYRGINIISVNWLTGRTQQITNLRELRFDPWHWKLVEPDKVFFSEREPDSGRRSPNELCVYDIKTKKVRVAFDGSRLGGGIGEFDIAGSNAAITTDNGRLCLVDLTKGNVRFQSICKNCYSPVFSPDGHKIAVIRNWRELIVKDVSLRADKLLYTIK